ncbi:MAG TPA: DUF4349 domain-containing protein [Candidatus Limnocylindria bacterium]|nr:DUF4349 domain-containing protein [Candidatus Limnocylindria bacterium]
MKHEIADLLPFYLNGTLDAAERARVETELATCVACSAELREHELLAAALRARADAVAPPSAAGLERALARIDTPPPMVRAVAPPRAPWYAVPARYASAAVLVVGFGAVAAAAWRAREGPVGPQPQPAGVYSVAPTVMESTVKMLPQTKIKINTIKEPTPAAAAAPTTVERQQRLAKRAELEIVVTSVEPALHRTQEIARAADGAVTALTDARPATPGALPGADLTIVVPAQRLDETLDRLARLGTVRNRSVTAEDVADTIVDEEARLANLRHEERDLRALMDKGGKVDEILAVQQNLSDVRGQIEQSEAQHALDLHRVATSTIALSLIEERPNPPAAKPGPTARIDGAWNNGLSALADTLVTLVSALAFVLAYAPLPLAVAGLTYAIFRVVLRRLQAARQA